jgi:hypothetical protein
MWRHGQVAEATHGIPEKKHAPLQDLRRQKSESMTRPIVRDHATKALMGK